MYSKVIQFYIYTYLFFFKFISHLGYYGILGGSGFIQLCYIFILFLTVGTWHWPLLGGCKKKIQTCLSLCCPTGQAESSKTVVLKLFGAIEWFRGRQFFHRPGWGWWFRDDGLGVMGMIQSLHLLCTLFLLLLYQLHLRSSGTWSWRLGTPDLRAPDNLEGFSDFFTCREGIWLNTFFFLFL